MGLHDAWAQVREWAHNHMDPRKRVATRIVVIHIHMWAVTAQATWPPTLDHAQPDMSAHTYCVWPPNNGGILGVHDTQLATTKLLGAHVRGLRGCPHDHTDGHKVLGDHT